MSQSRVLSELVATVGQWEYVNCHCIVKFEGRSGVFITYRCEACGNTNLRFIHTLEHTGDGRLIDLGLDCAVILLDDWDIPHLAENETKRKEKWRRHYRNPGRCITTVDDLIEKGKL